jgi:CheY-like chemotaxis protein
VRRQRVFVPSILVADDNTNIQKMVSLAFEDRGITVVAVGNGEAAVRRIPDLNPDLVLADIFMPVRNGYEVCEFIKKDQRFSHVPVILLVGAFDPLDEKEARRVGADGVLKKPFVPPDPLIAMVISALEKNPRVVAELAKAKAALEPHAMPEAAAPSFEVQALPKPEPKPLPDFPEPTPEEAALVYGFGKGVRAIDDDEQVGGAKEAPAPVSGQDEEEDEDFETGATARDWRRNAMDFDIPEEHVNRPAFSTVDELEPAVFFPSEADQPKAEPKFEPPINVAREVAPSVTPVIAQEVDLRALEPAEAAPVEHAPIGLYKDPDIAPPAAPPAEEPEPEPEPKAKPSLTSRMRHWMDALVSSPAPEGIHQESKANGDWVAALSEPHTEEVRAVEPPSAPEPPQTTALTVVKAAEENFFAEESAHTESVIAEAAPPELASIEMASPGVLAIKEASIEAASAVVETRGIAPNVEESAEGDDIAPAEIHAHETHGFEQAEAERAPEPEPPREIWERERETTPSFRDPDLEVPPPVHVTPEPLLVDQEPERAPNYLDYGEGQQEAPAAEAFEVAASPEPVAENEPVEEDSLPRPSFESAAAESLAAPAEERIPTGPPPSREALAEIPFLNPPGGFDPNAPVTPAPAAVDASTVDAVVQKLFERLQPQLHELLSEGVLRPLVENLLQQESEKKEK